MSSQIQINAIDDGSNNTYSTYTVNFEDESILTTVTHDPAIVTDWISKIQRIHNRRLSHLIVGLDIEWRPNFNGCSNPVATLQLCVGRRCLIYQLLYTDRIPRSLLDFMSKRYYTFVGVGIESDLQKLQDDYNIGYNVNAVDLRYLAADEYGREDLRNKGLKAIAAVVLDRVVDKPRNVTLSRWDNEWLSFHQIKYACVDAFVSFEIGRVLNASSA